MIMNIFYIILAALGLGLLVFIHELGHFIVARRVGMRVETFSIGFGKPFLVWRHKDVEWRLCWLFFGGYVKIAGTEGSKTGRDPYEIPDGFFGRRPIDRIKVALAGPVVNIVFAFLLFSLIWATGGREKPFSEVTQVIGWVDPVSELYKEGIRPGDELTIYDHKPFQGSRDLIYAAMLGDHKIQLQGFRVNYAMGLKQPFDVQVQRYQLPGAQNGIMTTGAMATARYMIYNQLEGLKESALLEGSPMADSGIQYGDRLVWMDGELLFSLEQLSHLLNDNRALLTVQRGNKTVLVRAPRVLLSDLRLPADVANEISDWQFAKKIRKKSSELYFLPYNFNNNCVVESTLVFIDEESRQEAFPVAPLSRLPMELYQGDKILAIDGVPVTKSADLLVQLQQRQVVFMVERDSALAHIGSWREADEVFLKNFNMQAIQAIENTIGTSNLTMHVDNYVLLNPVVPRTINEFKLTPEKKAWIATELLAQRKEIEAIADPQKKEEALRKLEESQKKLILGFRYLFDRKVNYNPPPTTLFWNICQETWQTLVAVLSGYLSPKWIGVGPIGIVQVIQHGWLVGIKEAIFWLAVISLNLGILNLIPIPVLDGGVICFAAFEAITHKRIKIKTMERLVLPFVVLLVGVFIFSTFQDLSRLFHTFFG